MSTIDAPQAGSAPADSTDVAGDDLPDGPPAAALIAAGVGCLAVGVLTAWAEASKSFRKTITYNDGVGPLSGKTILAVVVWLIAWGVLHYVLRSRPFPIPRALSICLVLTGLGVLLTFPTFFQMFGE